jgi:hypothetical protein
MNGVIMAGYILSSEGKPIFEPDPIKFAIWYDDKNNRRVAKTIVSNGVEVSTVFLAIDHSWNTGPPVLWETLVFGGQFDGHMDRYTSHEEALEGHEKIVKMVTPIQIDDWDQLFETRET